MKKLSQNLKQQLQNAKLSENELSRRTGIPQQVINRILSGKNKNPKIATLAPLARYFMISISQLLGEEEMISQGVNTEHLGWQEVPLIEGSNLIPFYADGILVAKNKIWTDFPVTSKAYAQRLDDTSMEPKFTKGTLLLIEPEKMPKSGDFVLLYLRVKNEVMLRQVFIKNKNIYVKCLNPKFKDYKLSPKEPDAKCVGVLIQSRTDHAIL